MRNEWQIQFPGLSLAPWEPWLAEAGVGMRQAVVHGWFATYAHPVDQAGEVVGHGGEGFGRCGRPVAAGLMRGSRGRTEARHPPSGGAVGGAAGPARGRTGLAQVAGHAPGLQDVAAGAPGHPGALPHDRLTATGGAPLGPSLASGRHPGHAADWRWRTVGGPGDSGRSAAPVDPRGRTVPRRPSSGRRTGWLRVREWWAGGGPRRPGAGPRVTGTRAGRPRGRSGCASLHRGRGLRRRRCRAGHPTCDRQGTGARRTRGP